MAVPTDQLVIHDDDPKRRELMAALGDAVQDAMEMDIALARFAMENGFTKSPGESGSAFLGRFCLYLSQMYLGMRGNVQPIPRICTCGFYSDDPTLYHEFPCELSEFAKRKR